MKIKLPRLIVALTLLFSFIACQRETNNPAPPPTPESPVNDNATVTASVRGVVVNENDQPVQGAAVISGTNNTTTDANGVFRFNSISLSAANGYVKVSKPGYFMGSRTFLTMTGRIMNVRIKLLPKTNAGNFIASTGGTITISGGGKLVIPASAITDAGGSSYTGTVNVAMTWINPTATDLPIVIPGDLRGITTTGVERGLQTFGMLGVELTGSSGQTLKIATGKTAELTFPIPSSLQGIAPATIDLWHFDETSGRWKQEGTATKTGSNYVGQVSHFSFWNCDAPFPLIKLCMKLINAANNLPLNNASVRIKRANVNSNGLGYTDSSGNLCGSVPKGEALVLEVLDQCWNVAYSKNIGPFNEDTDLGDVSVTIPANASLTITGTVVNCSNAVVTNGAAYITTSGGYSYSVPLNASGVFSYTVLRCNTTALNFSIVGVDYSTLQQGNVVNNTGTTGTVNVGNVQACGTAANEFLQLTIDGTASSYIIPGDSLISYSFLDSISNGIRVYVYAMRLNGSNPAQFSFSSPTASPGSYALLNCYVAAGGATGASQTIVSASPTITITEYGPAATGFIAGNFSIQMNFSGTIKNVIVSFRVRRY